ncbi:hypothetical protein GGR25_000557 [Kaistia hirudinis]|uniref:Uncharacterized protein n=1 Tax=Kaistia hirudinis TaxID=1293440 RepID=A0A840AJF7_9HYPH|nr:hypothetical protein [Kaistia hirudinis]
MEACGLDDHVGRDLAPIGEADPGRRQLLDRDAALHLDGAFDDQLRAADIDIIAGTGAIGLHHQPGLVLAEIHQESGRGELGVEIRVAGADPVIERALGRRLQRERRRHGKEIGLVDGEPTLGRRLRIDVEGELHQRLGPHHCGRRTLHHGDVRAALPEIDGDVMRRAGGADDDGALARIGRGLGIVAGMDQLALEVFRARQRETLRRTIGAGGEDELCRTDGHRLAIADELDRPALFALVEARRHGLSRGPVGELHQAHIGLQPVAHLVLGREDRPVLREGQIGQMVVPDRVVQHERAIAVAPAIARPGVLLDDDGRHAQHLEPGAEHDATLPAADDQHIGIDRAAERGFLAGPLFRPGFATAVRAMAHALRTAGAERLLEALQFGQRRQDGAGLAVLETDDPLAASDLGLEGEPGFDGAIGLGRDRSDPPGRGRGRRDRCVEEAADRVLACEGLHVPGEGDEIAPVAILNEEGEHAIRVAPREGIGERGHPARRIRCRCSVVHFPAFPVCRTAWRRRPMARAPQSPSGSRTLPWR